MATKRRKVWVEFDEDGTPTWVTDDKADKLDGSTRLCFIERLPGDVVLSREEAETVRKACWGHPDAIALLRGRR